MTLERFLIPGGTMTCPVCSCPKKHPDGGETHDRLITGETICRICGTKGCHKVDPRGGLRGSMPAAAAEHPAVCAISRHPTRLGAAVARQEAASAAGHRMIYVAHPVGGDVPGNVARAQRWLRWLMGECPEEDYVAPWLAEVLIFDDGDPDQRERSLQRMERVAARCDVVALVGGRISEGMRREAAAARAAGREVLDLTELGEEPPGGEP